MIMNLGIDTKTKTITLIEKVKIYDLVATLADLKINPEEWYIMPATPTKPFELPSIGFPANDNDWLWNSGTARPAWISDVIYTIGDGSWVTNRDCSDLGSCTCKQMPEGTLITFTMQG